MQIPPFWTMLAHSHAQIANTSELGRALVVSHTTFVIRQLRPWSENLGKRVVKSPKIYVADSGIVHALLQLPVQRDLEAHPKVGPSRASSWAS